jgi:hypothetical protein
MPLKWVHTTINLIEASPCMKWWCLTTDGSTYLPSVWLAGVSSTVVHLSEGDPLSPSPHVVVAEWSCRREDTHTVLVCALVYYNVQWNSLMRTLKNDTQDTFGCPKHPVCLCTLQPPKSGHLTNKDTLFCPKSVWILEMFWLTCGASSGFVGAESLMGMWSGAWRWRSVVLTDCGVWGGGLWWGGSGARTPPCFLLFPLQTLSHRFPSLARHHLAYGAVNESRVLTNKFRSGPLHVFRGWFFRGAASTISRAGSITSTGCAKCNVGFSFSVDFYFRCSCSSCSPVCVHLSTAVYLPAAWCQRVNECHLWSTIVVKFTVYSC